MFQQNHTSHGHSPLNHFKPSMKRAAFQKRMGPLLLGAMVLMIIGAVGLSVYFYPYLDVDFVLSTE